MPGDWDEVTQIRAITQIFGRADTQSEQVLLVDSDPAGRQWMREMMAGAFSIDEVDSGSGALERIASTPPRILVVGRELIDMSGGEWLETAAPQLAERGACAVFLLADASGISAEVDENNVKIFYRLLRTMASTRIIDLLEQAADNLPPRPPRDDIPISPAVAEQATKIGEATDVPGAAVAAIAAVHTLIGVDRARCLFCDAEAGTVWAEGEAGEHEAQASTGIVGFAIRTISSISTPRAQDDPLYQRTDDPAGTGNERLVVQPVVALDGRVHAVLVAVRDVDRPPFSSVDVATLSALAVAWAPYLQQLAMRVEADDIIGDRLDAGPSDMFRQEAILSMMRRGSRGDVVKVHPGWITGAYWLVLGALVGGGAFAAFAHVDEYAAGPAVVRYVGRSDVVAFEGGTISALDVARGQHVAAGQVLARLYDAEQAGKLQSIETEFERKLVSYLQTPADPAVRQAVAQVVSAREAARANVESRVIRAPRAGVVKEIMVRNGQQVEAGKVVLAIAEHDGAEGLTVLAFLPGADRPRLRAHQDLVLQLPGYRGAEIGGEVRAVSVEVLGAAEARTRYLGDRLGDSLPINGTVVVVEARLASSEFEADGHRYVLHDGMIGQAEVRLRSRSVLATLLPGLDL